MTNERAIQILEILISINGDVIIEGEYKEALEMAIRSLQQEQPCEDLEEAAKEYEHNRVYNKELEKYANYLDSLEEGETPKMKEPSPNDIYLLNRAIIEAFKAGAEWQKQQMLKDAVEGMITCVNLNRYILVPKLDESLTYGHKVKIVIIPEKEG